MGQAPANGAAQPASNVALATPSTAQTFLETYTNQANYYQSLMNQAFMANVQAQADTYASSFQNTVIGAAWVNAVSNCASYLAVTYPNNILYQTISNYLFVNPNFLGNAYQTSNWAQSLTVQGVFQFLSSMQSSSNLTFPVLTGTFYATDVPYMLNILTPIASSAYLAYTGLNTAQSSNVATNTSLQNVTIEVQQWISQTNPLAAQYGITPVQLSDIINNAQASVQAATPVSTPSTAVSLSTSAPTGVAPSGSTTVSAPQTSQIPAAVPATGVLPPVPSIPITSTPPTAMINTNALSPTTPDPTTQAIEQAAATAPVSIPLSQAISPTSTFTAGIMDLSLVQAPKQSNIPLYIAAGLIGLILLS
jgi:hypothetical protein